MTELLAVALFFVWIGTCAGYALGYCRGCRRAERENEPQLSSDPTWGDR